MTAPSEQKPRRRNEMTGYYTTKHGAMRLSQSRVDARTTEGRQVLRDRTAFKKQCGTKLYNLKRRELWQIAERLKRVLNRIDPLIFARSSLVNKRHQTVMPIALDYMRLVTAYQDAIAKVFDGLPETKPTDDPLARLRRKLQRKSREIENGAGKPSEANL